MSQYEEGYPPELEDIDEDTAERMSELSSHLADPSLSDADRADALREVRELDEYISGEIDRRYDHLL